MATASRRGSALVLACLLALAAGCETQPTQEQTGRVVGGVLGGVLGAQVGEGSGRTAATIIGAIVGASIGGAVGRSMDENDRRRVAHTLETGRTGAVTEWVNPDTGNRFKVVPTQTYSGTQGPCREYTMDAVVGGRPDKVYGTACRQPDGSWRVVG